MRILLLSTTIDVKNIVYYTTRGKKKKLLPEVIVDNNHSTVFSLL